MASLMRIWRLLRGLLAIVGVGATVLGLLIGYPLSRPPVLQSVLAGARAIDESGLPGPSRFQARDGSSLAFRLYPAANGNSRNIVIVIHGSAGHSTSMNEVAKRIAADNLIAVSPDIRGHGESGTRGDIGYIGQLDDDLEDLIAELRRLYPGSHFSLLGFSSGGGFALRAAGGRLGGDFDRLVLLSPYLGYDAPSSRSADSAAQWASVNLPRIITLTILHRAGVPCCEALPVIAFGLPPGSEKYVTTVYSYRLLINFGPPVDLAAALHALKIPAAIIAGGSDELMQSDKYSEIVRGIEPAIAVDLLPGLGHMDMLHAPAALDAISKAFSRN